MDNQSRTILARRILLVLILIILLGLIVWTFFIRDSSPATTSKTTAPTTQEQANNKPTEQPKPTDNRPSTTVQPQTPPKVNGQSTTLANTGPGDVAAVFVGTSIISAIAHHLYRRRVCKRLGV